MTTNTLLNNTNHPLECPCVCTLPRCTESTIPMALNFFACLVSRTMPVHMMAGALSPVGENGSRQQDVNHQPKYLKKLLPPFIPSTHTDRHTRVQGPVRRRQTGSVSCAAGWTVAGRLGGTVRLCCWGSGCWGRRPRCILWGGGLPTHNRGGGSTVGWWTGGLRWWVTGGKAYRVCGQCQSAHAGTGWVAWAQDRGTRGPSGAGSRRGPLLAVGGVRGEPLAAAGAGGRIVGGRLPARRRETRRPRGWGMRQR